VWFPKGMPARNEETPAPRTNEETPAPRTGASSRRTVDPRLSKLM
jgi:hypothetical protein